MSIPHLQKLSQGLPILDIRSGGYTLEEVQALYTALGSEGRSYYLFPQLFFDIFYPGLFAVTYTWIIIRLLQQLSIQNKWLKGLCYQHGCRLGGEQRLDLVGRPLSERLRGVQDDKLHGDVLSDTTTGGMEFTNL